MTQASRDSPGPTDANGASSVDAQRVAPRRTPLSVRGEPMLWLTGMALTLSVAAVVALLGVVLWQGSLTFWPKPLRWVELKTGEAFLGLPTRAELYTPEPARKAAIIKGLRDGDISSAVATPNGRLRRRLYRVGNKEFNNQPFRWVDLIDIAQVSTPTNALLLERTQWGVWLGEPERIVRVTEHALKDVNPSDIELTGELPTRWGIKPVAREILEATDAGVRVREVVTVAKGARDTLAMLRQLQPEAAARRRRIIRLKRSDIGWVNTRLERERLALRSAQMRRSSGKISDAALAKSHQRFDERKQSLDAEYAGIEREIAAIEREDNRWRVVVTDPASKRFAPIAQTTPNDPMRISQIVRSVPGGELRVRDKLGVYFSRWWEFIASAPREANTEGGVFPVIFGTVMMTMLLSVIVVPLGVVAALYLREYARQGVVVSIVRIAINNLAGVPSIVYGVFGLGFFCYTLGAWIDKGPQNPWPANIWALGLGGMGLIGLGAAALGLFARPRAGSSRNVKQRLAAFCAAAMWLGAAAIVVGLIAYSPFFDGFFRVRLPSPTFGTKGILWSSLTLALLTLPVVVVATEEAISAVPGSMREGSYGCGASKWQTIRRIVLPMAAPGVMTGMILAIARGAGEVAPLMLVGAVKLAPELPFEPHFPFLHLERSFMHLGFHIYDVGFQSPDSEAARPIVWTTTLLLIFVVFVLNLAAIVLRSRMRRRLGVRAV